jgi:hypothetical protein
VPTPIEPELTLFPINTALRRLRATPIDRIRRSSLFRTLAAMDAAAGLCATCAHARTVASPRGSTFILCERSKTDPRYTRYPRLPVMRCAGHEPRPGDAPGARPSR